MEPTGTEASDVVAQRDVLSLPVLLLNRHFAPVTVATAKRAFCLLYGGAAHAALPSRLCVAGMDFMLAAVDGSGRCSPRSTWTP